MSAFVHDLDRGRPDAVLTRRTNEPTPGGYRPHPAGLLVTTRDTDPTTNPLIRAISQHPTAPDPQQRYNSGQAGLSMPERAPHTPRTSGFLYHINMSR